MKTYEERAERVREKIVIQKRLKRKRVRAISVAAGALSLVLALNLTLFVPYTKGGTNVLKYQDSDYYSIICSLSPLTYGVAYKTNNYREYVSPWLDSMFAVGSAAPAEEPSVYEEVTNNQTEGVIEGDLFKRSSEYIYYVSSLEAETVTTDEGKTTLPARYLLQIYSIEGENSALVSSFPVLPEVDTTFVGYGEDRELFLSEDLCTVTLLTPCYDAKKGVLYTAAINLDVSDPAAVSETSRTYLSGQYVSSRMKDGNLLLVSNFSVVARPDFGDESQFLPQVGALGALETLPVGDIVVPDSVYAARYTVICSLNAETLAVDGCVAFLAYSDEVYVSSENLFVMRSYTQTEENGDDSCRYPATEIFRVSYAENGLELKGSFSVRGEINDRYSLDEYNGVLRVFTTTQYYAIYENGVFLSSAELYAENASLYCIDLETSETIASVERFAPDGESVMSARFRETTAYVCTAVVYEEVNAANDPVYAFDLSDYSNITYTDTGTIPGYALSLVTFANDTLLGVGYGDSLDDLKVSVYRETASGVTVIDTYESQDTSFSADFKAYMVDTANSLVGLGIAKENFCGYLVLRFDGYNLTAVDEIAFDSSADDMRAFYLDGYLYLLGNNAFQAVALSR